MTGSPGPVGSAGGAVPDDERLARVALNAVGEPGSLRMAEEVATKGGLRAYEDLLAGRSTLSTDLAARVQRVDAGAELGRAARRGIRFLVPGDAEWPTCVDDLAFAESLQERGGVPVGLWVRGHGDLGELCREAVAIVGSRTATSYGAGLASDIGAAVAGAGYTVVSGAAIGIDCYAHQGALDQGKPTVAVLACGADRSYPTKNAALIEAVARSGVVVSEAPLGGAPRRIRFLARNRLIAAFCRGTVVVEAAVRSGALNTASWTAGLGRTLMGVPGPVGSATSAGVHQLIRNRGALLVTHGAEVLEAVGPVGSFLLAEPRAEAHPRDTLGDLDGQVLDAAPVVHPASTESIARSAGVRPQLARKALDRLVRLGLVERCERGWRVLRGPTG